MNVGKVSKTENSVHHFLLLTAKLNQINQTEIQRIKYHYVDRSAQIRMNSSGLRIAADQAEGGIYFSITFPDLKSQ